MLSTCDLEATSLILADRVCSPSDVAVVVDSHQSELSLVLQVRFRLRQVAFFGPAKCFDEPHDRHHHTLGPRVQLYAHIFLPKQSQHVLGNQNNEGVNE
jgi:hypothetical protein